MRLKCVEVISEHQKKMFINLPKELYDKKRNNRDSKQELQIIEGTHVLSKEFKVTPVIIIDQDAKKHKAKKLRALGRCIITEYENDDNVYIGFVDSINDRDVIKTMLDYVDEYTKRAGKHRIVGPLDCSFWIGYRFNIDNFDHPYSCEPYNMPYYYEMFKDNGYEVCDTYYSNHYRQVPQGFENSKHKHRYDTMVSKGYKEVRPTFSTFETHLRNIYKLLIELYKDFPTFKYIDEETFVANYKSLKYILDYDMVMLIYKENELKGFAVNVPDYGFLINHINLINLMKIMHIRRHPKKYILLYMGVARDSLGLGGAMAEMIKNQLIKNKCTSVGALIHEGKVSGGFYKELSEYRTHYVLMSKIIQ